MSLTAKLSGTVYVTWTTPRGIDRECDVEVQYEFDGRDDLKIISARPMWEVTGIGEREFDELVDAAVFDLAHDAYGEWEADYGDYLYEQFRDRMAPEGYVPGDLL